MKNKTEIDLYKEENKRPNETMEIENYWITDNGEEKRI